MLVLPVQSAGEVIALRDDALADRVYVALSRPQVARGIDGQPRFRLLRWAAQTDNARTVGGRLSLDVNLQPSAAQLSAAGLGERTPMPLPWLDATVRLEGPQFEPVDAEVSIAGAGIAALSVDLSAAAASVLAPLLRGDNVMPLQVVWTGHVQVRLPAVEVIASGDVSEIRRRVEIAGGGRQVTTTRSIIDANVHIEIRGTDRPELERALRDWVLDELVRRFTGNLPLTVHAAASDVVRWPITLATTLDDFVAAPARGALVETFVLDGQDLGAALPVEVRVLGDFAGRLERVDVRVAPLGSDAVTELSFTDTAARNLRLGTRDVRFAYRVKLDDRAAGPWSAWSEVRGATSIAIPVAVPETVTIEVAAIGLDLDTRWASVTVAAELQLADAPPVVRNVVLDAQHRSVTFAQPLDGVRGAMKARVTYLSRQGETLERLIDDVAGDQIIVGDPLEGSRIGLVVVPAGNGWDDVALAMVDLRYADGAHVVDETVELRKLDDLVEWQAPARPDGPRSVQWRVHTSFKDGRFESGTWQSTDAGVAVVRIDAVPRRTVQIFPIHFDPAVVRQGVVRLRSDARSESVSITDRTPRSIVLAPGAFDWTIAWTAADGAELPESAPQPGEDVIVLPRVTRSSP